MAEITEIHRFLYLDKYVWYTDNETHKRTSFKCLRWQFKFKLSDYERVDLNSTHTHAWPKVAHKLVKDTLKQHSLRVVTTRPLLGKTSNGVFISKLRKNYIAGTDDKLYVYASTSDNDDALLLLSFLGAK